MYCPECGAEYVPGVDRCADCDVPLVHELPGEDHEATPYETVFETSETDVIPVIKSLLQSADIPYRTEGEAMMNLFPSDLLGRVMSRPGAEVAFLVPADRVEEARELLTEQPIPEGEYAGGDEDADPEP